MLAIASAISLVGVPLVSRKWLFFYSTYTANIAVEFYKYWPPLGHLWSLAVEEQFYVIAAPLFLLTAANKAKYVVGGMIGTGVLSLVLLFAAGAPNISIGTDSLISFSNLGIGSALAMTTTISKGRASAPIVAGLAGMIAISSLPWLLQLRVDDLAVSAASIVD